VGLQDGADDRQPEACPGGVGGGQRLEERGAQVLGDPWSVILEEQLDLALPRFERRSPDPQGAPMRLRLYGIFIHLSEGLREEDRVGEGEESGGVDGLGEGEFGGDQGEGASSGEEVEEGGGLGGEGFPASQGQDGLGGLLGLGDGGGGAVELGQEAGLVAAVASGEEEGGGGDGEGVA
jgi:hypothetical protein